MDDRTGCRYRSGSYGDFVRKVIDYRLRRNAVDTFQFLTSELACAADGGEQIQLNFFNPYLGNIEMEVTNRVLLKLLLHRFIAFYIWQPADAMALITAMQG